MSARCAAIGCNNAPVEGGWCASHADYWREPGLTRTPDGDPVASQKWPPEWCVVCDVVPSVPHVRNDGHKCEVAMRINPSLSRAKIKKIRARFDAMRGKPSAP